MLSNSSPEGCFLRLIAAVLNEQAVPPLPDGISADGIFAVGKRQEMTAITYCALSNLPGGQDCAAFKQPFLAEVMRGEIQLSEFNSLLTHLCGNGVTVMPVKGCVIRELYPSPSMRQMTDIDLLYSGVSSTRLAKLMAENGYEAVQLETGPHDSFRKKPVMNVELHTRLVSNGNKCESCFDGIAARARRDEALPNLLHMTPEDIFIHTIVHALKHFEESGLGVRPLCDIYLLVKKYSAEWDSEYIDRKLGKVGLKGFADRLVAVAMMWFGGADCDCDKETELFFFRGGAFGICNEGLRWSAAAEATEGRNRFVLRRVFRPYDVMCEQYPVLVKHPALLPAMWVAHWFEVLFRRPQSIGALVKTNSGCGKEEVAYASRIKSGLGLK